MHWHCGKCAYVVPDTIIMASKSFFAGPLTAASS